jgi:hypothetical protein
MLLVITPGWLSSSNEKILKTTLKPVMRAQWAIKRGTTKMRPTSLKEMNRA